MLQAALGKKNTYLKDNFTALKVEFPIRIKGLLNTKSLLLVEKPLTL